MNCNACPTSFQCAVNNTKMHVLSFSSQLKMLSCFVLRKYSVNSPSAGKPNGEDKSVGMSRRNSGVLVMKCFGHCIMRYFDVRTICSTKSYYILMLTMRSLVTVDVGLMVCLYKCRAVVTMFSLIMFNYF